MDKLFRQSSVCLLIYGLIGCSQSDSSSKDPNPIQNKITKLTASFQDQNPAVEIIAGNLIISINKSIADDADYTVQIDLIDKSQKIVTTNWYTNKYRPSTNLSIPTLENFNNDLYGFKVSLIENEKLIASDIIRILDFTGNAQMTGTGGAYNNKWEYGKQKPSINIRRDNDNNLCYLDNGFVQVIDMNDQKDLRDSGIRGKSVDDSLYPAYSFSCAEAPHNTERAILIDDLLEATDDNIWTYSVLNDAMHYGNRTYQHLHNLLGTPPLDDKLRIRVHYGTPFTPFINWDGGYANFTEGYPDVHPSPVTLDILGHEIGHGVLNRLTPSFNNFDRDFSLDIKTTHEAFSDITGFVVKYKETQQKLWIHGEDANLAKRQLNKIVTEEGAVESYLDYEDAGRNPYLGIGLLTYPFYLLSKTIGIEDTYSLYVHAAQNCWQDDHTLQNIAACIKSSSDSIGQSSDDVVQAFKSVKIKLFEEGVLSHYEYEKFKLNVQFEDTSQSTGQTTEWHWDFGDGNSSTEANPNHSYSSKGTYNATLSVKDNSSDTDVFTRTIEVTDEYCAPLNTSINVAQINTVDLNSNSLGYNSNLYSYVYDASTITDKSDIAIEISGNKNDESGDIIWTVWLDKNNNGIYEDSDVIKTETVSASENYSWKASLDLSDIDLTKAQFLRIAGKRNHFFPCSIYKGQMIDIELQ